MLRTALTCTEAETIASELRAIHTGTDWKVNVYPPRYRGDYWLIFVE